MAHPEWALKHKTKGTELRNISGRFYLYRISSKWDKEKKVTKKITHELLGRITEQDGLIPRGSKKSKSDQLQSDKTQNLTNITTKEYGASNYLKTISNDIITNLRTHFPNHYQEIFTLAVNRLLHQSPLKNMEFIYESSMLSEEFRDLDLSKNRLTSLMKELGSNRSAITDFMKNYIQGLENIVFDTTHSVSKSNKMQLNQVGYNSQGCYDPQVNLFYMFATDQQSPVYYRIFPGNIQGMTALKLTIKESGLKDACVVGDKGFCSEANMDMLDDDAALPYILPLKRDSRFINYDRLQDRDYDKAFDGHFLYHNRPIFYYRYSFIDKPKKNAEKKSKERNVIIFFDPRLHNEEEASYLRRANDKSSKYTIDGFKEKQRSFGTMAMVHTLKSENVDGKMIEVPAQKIYEKYKSRMEVETVFDMYKNLLQADRSYMQSDSSFEAWVFINHLASMMYYKIVNIIKSKNKLGTISPKDLLARLARISKLLIGTEWINSEIPRSSSTMLKTLGIVVT
jgi:transposase